MLPSMKWWWWWRYSSPWSVGVWVSVDWVWHFHSSVNSHCYCFNARKIPQWSCQLVESWCRVEEQMMKVHWGATHTVTSLLLVGAHTKTWTARELSQVRPELWGPSWHRLVLSYWLCVAAIVITTTAEVLGASPELFLLNVHEWDKPYNQDERHNTFPQTCFQSLQFADINIIKVQVLFLLLFFKIQKNDWSSALSRNWNIKVEGHSH